MVYPAWLPLMRTPRLPVVDWTDAPADLNGLIRFAERRNLVSARVPSHFNWPLRVFPSVLDKSSEWPSSPQQAAQVCIPPSGCMGLVCEVDRSLQSSVEINVWRSIPPLLHTPLPCVEGKYWWPSVGRVLVGLMRNSVIGFDCDAQERCYGQSVNGGTISGWWRRMWRHNEHNMKWMLLRGETDRGYIQDLQGGFLCSLIKSQLELSQRKRWRPSVASTFCAILLYNINATF